MYLSHTLPTHAALPDQAQYWAGDGPYNFVPVSAFEGAFNASGLGQEGRAILQTPPHTPAGDKDALVNRPYAISGMGTWQSVWGRISI